MDEELVLAAMLEWSTKYGGLPSSYDWSGTHANRRGGAALKRLRSGKWPAASVVGRSFGSWQQARETAVAAGAHRRHFGLVENASPTEP